MSTYQIIRDLPSLNTNILLEIFADELFNRIQRDKAELRVLEQVVPILEKKFEVLDD